MHRAITHDGRAVAVKVQYPGIAETIAADLDNVALLRRMLRITAPSQDVDALLAELRERVLEELDYRREAANQRLFAAYYDGHPTISVPQIIGELSTRRVVTSELADGARFAELAELVAGRARPGRRDDLPVRVPQPVRGCTRSTATRIRATTCSTAAAGSPSSTSAWSSTSRGDELQPLMQMARNLCVRQRPRGVPAQPWRTPGSCVPDAPLSTETIVEHLAVFYATIREPGR